MALDLRKKLFRNTAPATGLASDNGPTLGSYLDVHDGPHAAKRRTALTEKIYIVIIGISLIINIILAIAVMQLLPLYRVVPFFVTFSDRADQIVRIEPPTGNLQGLDVLTDASVREYVSLRHTISDDPQRTIDSWGGKVRLMSTNDVYNAFLNETKPVYDSLTERKFTRSIIINSVLRTGPQSYQVEFDAIDRRIGSGLTDSGEERRTFVANLRVANIPQNTSYQNRFLNPLGFTVGAYSVAAKR